MEVAPSHTLSRVSLLALWGVGAAFVWLLVSLFSGTGGAPAHADDSTDNQGVLSGLTATVDRAADAVVSVATTAVGVVAPVVPPATPSARAVAHAAAPVVAPVQQVIHSAVPAIVNTTTAVVNTTKAVVNTATNVVTAVPVVGEVVTRLGVEHALTEVTTTLDEALATLAGAVGSTPIELSPTGAAAPAHSLEFAAASSPLLSPTLSEHAPAASAPTVWAFVLLTSAGTPPTSHAFIFEAPTDLASAPISTLCPLAPGGSSSGSSNSAPSAAALLAFSPFVAHRAWLRRIGPSDDTLPPTPPASTDVSPD